MTISKGATWGRRVPRPDDLRIARDDAELAAMLDDGSGRPTAVAAGDMWKTVGAAPVDGRDELNEFPLDLLDVEIDGVAATAVSHVVARSHRWAGGALRGPLAVVMNAEFIGDYDVAPRGHPNDGRVELLRVGSDMGIRQRLAARSRLKTGTHLPHPQITTRSVRSIVLDDLGSPEVIVDGRSRGRASRIVITVRPDAALLYA